MAAESAIVMRVHRVRAEVVVAACDRELLGQDLKVGSRGRCVNINSHFYGERVVSEEEFLGALRRATTANLLGRHVTQVALRGGYLSPEGIGELGGVPHAEIFTMEEG